MIYSTDMGPRAFYREDAAWEYRDEMGGWLFLPDPAYEMGEVYWFPMAMTPTVILRHRLTAGLSGRVTAQRGATYLKRGGGA